MWTTKPLKVGEEEGVFAVLARSHTRTLGSRHAHAFGGSACPQDPTALGNGDILAGCTEHAPKLMNVSYYQNGDKFKDQG